MRHRSVLRILRAASTACGQQCQTIAQTVISVPAVEQHAVQSGIDYAAWALQQQAWRGFAAAPARAMQDSVQEVAERKLADARSRHETVQKAIAEANPATETYQRLMRESAYLTPLAEGYQRLQQLHREVAGLQELLSPQAEHDLKTLAEEEMQLLQQEIADLRQQLLLSLLPPESNDEASVVLEIRSSVGGDWTASFAEDLLDMYRRFAALNGWRFEVLESNSGNIGGVKSATALVTGPGAFGQLRWESGVHRATMIPENDKHGRMQTGTVVVVAMPEASEVEVKIAETDLRIETCRASGKGGQHVNTTDSAVRIVHLPTGIAASCQNERSQGQNKAQALRVLRAKLFELEEQKKAAELASHRKAAAATANTNERIRSYNYQDSRVSDHRVGLTINIDVARFMEAERLGEVIQAVKMQRRQQLLEEMLQDE